MEDMRRVGWGLGTIVESSAGVDICIASKASIGSGLAVVRLHSASMGSTGVRLISTGADIDMAVRILNVVGEVWDPEVWVYETEKEGIC